MSYHLTPIVNGVFGEVSKIQEEYGEFMDSLSQGVELMALQELSDMLGAIEGWLDKYHPSISLEDLIAMKDVTQRAFLSGHRKPRNGL